MIGSVILGIVLNLLLASGAFLKKAITGIGAVSGFVLGIGLFFLGGWQLWAALAFFFVSSTLIGKIKATRRGGQERIVQKHGRRDWIQVFANALPSLLFAVFYSVTGSPLWITASFAVLAAANADTWANEIGVLSSSMPRSILTGKPVEPGISGGITLLGTSASAAGALLVALLAWGFGAVQLSHTLIITLCGIFGSVVDSLLGAGLQAKYLHAEYGYITEKPEGNTLTAGLVWMTNDMVNLLSVTSAGWAAGAG